MASKTATNNPKSVLVVDDDAELCGLIGEVLKGTADFRVEAVHDGRRGLELAWEPRFDLIILDVMLPVVDGFEVLKQIRKRSRVPVILLTSRTERQDRVTGLDSGADDYLPKRFWPEELLARVRAVLRWSAVSLLTSSTLTLASDQIRTVIALNGETGGYTAALLTDLS